jgi:hypothetical protein
MRVLVRSLVALTCAALLPAAAALALIALVSMPTEALAQADKIEAQGPHRVQIYCRWSGGWDKRINFTVDKKAIGDCSKNGRQDVQWTPAGHGEVLEIWPQSFRQGTGWRALVRIDKLSTQTWRTYQFDPTDHSLPSSEIATIELVCEEGPGNCDKVVKREPSLGDKVGKALEDFAKGVGGAIGKAIDHLSKQDFAPATPTTQTPAGPSVVTYLNKTKHPLYVYSGEVAIGGTIICSNLTSDGLLSVGDSKTYSVASQRRRWVRFQERPDPCPSDINKYDSWIDGGQGDQSTKIIN